MISEPWITILDVLVRFLISLTYITLAYLLFVNLLDKSVLRRAEQARASITDRPTPSTCRSCHTQISGPTQLEVFQNYSKHYSQNHQ